MGCRTQGGGTELCRRRCYCCRVRDGDGTERDISRVVRTRLRDDTTTSSSTTINDGSPTSIRWCRQRDTVGIGWYRVMLVLVLALQSLLLLLLLHQLLPNDALTVQTLRYDPLSFLLPVHTVEGCARPDAHFVGPHVEDILELAQVGKGILEEPMIPVPRLTALAAATPYPLEDAASLDRGKLGGFGSSLGRLRNARRAGLVGNADIERVLGFVLGPTVGRERSLRIKGVVLLTSVSSVAIAVRIRYSHGLAAPPFITSMSRHARPFPGRALMEIKMVLPPLECSACWLSQMLLIWARVPIFLAERAEREFLVG